MARVLSQPKSRDALQAGIDALAGAVVPTLGPLTGPVALDDKNRGGSPELLDDGGTIARRILQLDDPNADVGAMLLREILWRQREVYGDGAATAAVMFQTVFAKGHRFINAGGNAMLLRRALETGMRHLLDGLRQQIQPLAKKADMERIARSICGESDIARRWPISLTCSDHTARLKSARAGATWVTSSSWVRTGRAKSRPTLYSMGSSAIALN